MEPETGESEKRQEGMVKWRRQAGRTGRQGLLGGLGDQGPKDSKLVRLLFSSPLLPPTLVICLFKTTILSLLVIKTKFCRLGKALMWLHNMRPARVCLHV